MISRPLHFHTPNEARAGKERQCLADFKSSDLGFGNPLRRNPDNNAPGASGERDATPHQSLCVPAPENISVCHNPHSSFHAPAVDGYVSNTEKAPPRCAVRKGSAMLEDILAELDDSIPSTAVVVPMGELGVAVKDVHGQMPREMADEMEIIRRAMCYISRLEQMNRSLLQERLMLESKMAAYQRLYSDHICAMGKRLAPIEIPSHLTKDR